MSEFIQIEVVSYTPAQTNPNNGELIAEATNDMFTMNVRPEYVIATNIVTSAPVDSVKSIVFFSADSGIKPVLCTLSPEEVVALVDEAY